MAGIVKVTLPVLADASTVTNLAKLVVFEALIVKLPAPEPVMVATLAKPAVPVKVKELAFEKANEVAFAASNVNVLELRTGAVAFNVCCDVAAVEPTLTDVAVAFVTETVLLPTFKLNAPAFTPVVPLLAIVTVLVASFKFTVLIASDLIVAAPEIPVRLTVDSLLVPALPVVSVAEVAKKVVLTSETVVAATPVKLTVVAPFV